MGPLVRSLATLTLASGWWLLTGLGPRFEPAAGWSWQILLLVSGGYALLTSVTAWALGATVLGTLLRAEGRRALRRAALPWPVLLVVALLAGLGLGRALPGSPWGAAWLAAAAGATAFAGGVAAARLIVTLRARRAPARVSRPSRDSISPTPA